MAHTPRKRFGQNFLQDQHIIDQIIAAIHPQPKQAILEIGPGQGAMTQPLLHSGADLTVVEIDRDLAADLQTHYGDSLTLIQQDILQVDLTQLASQTSPIRVVGNLPYNISTPLLFHLFSHIDVIQDMHFMLQQEVVQRLAAQPGSKAYGRLSVMAQYYCDVSFLMHVPPHAFHPPPKVDSAIVRLVPHQDSPFDTVDPERLSRLVKTAFQQRRKTLANNLKDTLSKEAIAALDINPQTRPEQLTIAEFIRLTNAC